MENNNKGKGQLSRLGDASRLALSPSGRNANCEPEVAAARATILFGYYPRNEANDPEIFIAGATAMLSSYPEVVVERVCDPIRGLPSKNKFLPSIAEIRETCEREMVWHDAVDKRERERAHTREVLAGHKAAIGSPEHTRVVEGFKSLRAVLGKPAIEERPATMLDARHAPTPEIRERAAAFHEARLEALKAEYAATPPKIGPALQNYSAKNPDILGEAKLEDCG
jgi:hypothetical protein